MDSCLFVGTSLVREGLDVNDLELTLGGPGAVNIGTTAPYGAAGVFELQAQIVAARGNQKFECVVIGFNSHYLFDFTPESFDLTSTDYASQLPSASLTRLAIEHHLQSQLANLAFRIAYPFGRHSLILQRIYREALFELHQSLIGRLSLEHFETFPDELKPASSYFYLGPSIYIEATEEMARVVSSMGMDNPEKYNDAGPTISFRKSVNIFSTLTDRLYILRMPLTHVYDTAEAASAEAFASALQSLPINGVMSCDFPKAQEPDVFYDSGHLNANGRRILSREVGAMLQLAMTGHESVAGTICGWD